MLHGSLDGPRGGESIDSCGRARSRQDVRDATRGALPYIEGPSCGLELWFVERSYLHAVVSGDDAHSNDA